MNYDMKECGKRVCQLRIKAGLTQQKVAELLNIDRSFYSRIEAGKSGCSVDLFVQLSGLFGISLDYLILGMHSRTLFANTERKMLKERIDKLTACLEQVRASL